MRKLGALVAVVLMAATACAAPSDNDGEIPTLLAHASARAAADATPVVVDTDLAGDDLVAIAFLLQQPSVDVRAVTIAATGEVGCDAGVDVVTGLFAAMRHAPLPIACGRETAGGDARTFPKEWRKVAEAGTGIQPVRGSRVPRAADEMLAEMARDTKGLVVVALGPLTNLADLVASHPRDYARLAGVHSMIGTVDGGQGDVAEWNAAADPDALAVVLAAPAPLTVVPEDAVPDGTPKALDGAPVVGRVAAAIEYPKWWDLSTAAAFVVPDAGRMETGRWISDPAEPGRLRRVGDGSVRVYRSMDESVLGTAFEKAFRAG